MNIHLRGVEPSLTHKTKRQSTIRKIWLPHRWKGTCMLCQFIATVKGKVTKNGACHQCGQGNEALAPVPITLSETFIRPNNPFSS